MNPTYRRSIRSGTQLRSDYLVFLLGVLCFQALGAGSKPQFVEHTIATHLNGGYQVVVSDLNRDGKPDLVALASGTPRTGLVRESRLAKTCYRLELQPDDQLRGPDCRRPALDCAGQRFLQRRAPQCREYLVA